MPTPHIRFDRPAGPAFMRSIGLVPDPWQTDVLDGNHRRLLLNCSRQAGKSTTVAGLIARARAAGMAVIVLDVEGEYTALHEPADHKPMLAALRDRGLSPVGVPAPNMAV